MKVEFTFPKEHAEIREILHASVAGEPVPGLHDNMAFHLSLTYKGPSEALQVIGAMLEACAIHGVEHLLEEPQLHDERGCAIRQQWFIGLTGCDDQAYELASITDTVLGMLPQPVNA